MESKFWEAVLTGYNATSPSLVKDSIEKARNAGIAIIAMKNLLNPATYPRQPIKDIRKDKTKKISVEQALIKWVLDDPYVDTTIPGIKSFEQLSEDVAIMGMKLSFEDKDKIRWYCENSQGDYCRGVAGCTECLHQCPFGVKLNDLNRCLSYAYGYGNTNLAIENYLSLPSTSHIEICRDCVECVVKCPNGINTTRTIQLVRKLFESSRIKKV